jgi:hypothetical protein
MSKPKAPAAPAGTAPRSSARGTPGTGRNHGSNNTPQPTQAPGRSGEGSSSALQGMKEQQRSKASLRTGEARDHRPSAS